jgi:hypothetical protein
MDRKLCAAVPLVAALLLSAGALSAKDETPVMYPFSEMRAVAVLPVLDSRAGKKEGVNFEKVRKDAMKMLSRKRYVPLASERGTESLAKLTEDDLKTATPDFIRGLGPNDQRWVLVFCLADAKSKITLGSSANAQAMMFLFDKKLGKVAWSDTGTGQSATAGLDGMLFKKANRSTAIAMAMYQMVSAFPKLPKAQK